MRTILLLWLISASLLWAAFGYRAARNKAEIVSLETETKHIAELTTAERERSDLQVVHLREQLDAVRNKVARAEAMLAVRKAALPASVPRKSPALQKKIETDPSYDPFRRRDARRRLFQLYGNVLGPGTLPPEKLERLKRLLEERNHSVNDALEITGNTGAQKITELGVVAMMQTQTAMDTEIHALVGDALYHDIKYGSFYRSLDPESANFEDTLLDRGLPALDPAQRDALKAAYRAAHFPRVPGEEKDPVIRGQHGPESDAKVVQLVSGALSAEQREALESFLRDKQRASELMGLARRRVKDALKAAGE